MIEKISHSDISETETTIGLLNNTSQTIINHKRTTFSSTFHLLIK
jgi:hypothetical protein